MNRRDFIQGTGLGLAVIFLPGWLPACSGGVDTGESGPLDGTPKSGAEALALAKRNGRPLLVFVVPGDSSLRFDRGEVIGVYLNRADDESMADLSLCGVWCATPTEIRADFARNVADSTIAVLIETDGSDAARVCDYEGLDRASLCAGNEEEWASDVAKLRTPALQSKLHALIAPDKDTLRRRMDLACAKSLPRANHDHLGEMKDGDVPNALHVARVPAWVRWRAEDADPKTRAGWIAMLAAEAARRWRSDPPPRARWGKSTGCGMEYENEWFGGFKWNMPQCGIGHTTAYSARFLEFLCEKG